MVEAAGLGLGDAMTDATDVEEGTPSGFASTGVPRSFPYLITERAHPRGEMSLSSSLIKQARCAAFSVDIQGRLTLVRVAVHVVGRRLGNCREAGVEPCPPPGGQRCVSVAGLAPPPPYERDHPPLFI
jgi:hypothetical protein